jgi:hypothetical protein
MICLGTCFCTIYGFKREIRHGNNGRQCSTQEQQKVGSKEKKKKTDRPTQDDFDRSILEMILPELPNLFEICIPAIIRRPREGDPVLIPADIWSGTRGAGKSSAILLLPSHDGNVPLLFSQQANSKAHFVRSTLSAYLLSVSGPQKSPLWCRRTIRGVRFP